MNLYNLRITCSVDVSNGLVEVAVHSNAPLTVANGKAIHPADVTAAAVSMTSSAKSAPTHTQHPHSENDGITDVQTSLLSLSISFQIDLGMGERPIFSRPTVY